MHMGVAEFLVYVVMAVVVQLWSRLLWDLFHKKRDGEF